MKKVLLGPLASRRHTVVKVSRCRQDAGGPSKKRRRTSILLGPLASRRPTVVKVSRCRQDVGGPSKKRRRTRILLGPPASSRPTAAKVSRCRQDVGGPSKNSSSKLSPEEFRAMLRSDFAGFIHCAFAELCPRDGYQPNWHLDVLADRLEQVRRGAIKRLIVNLPPRHLKSLAASVALPAFWLGHDPCAQIICASYGQELASKLSRDCRALMQSRFYKQLFATRLSKTQAAMDEFETTAHGFRLATSVGGVLTGRGADVLIVDDPLKPEEAVSKTRARARQSLVRQHALQPPQRQARGRHRRHHAAPARGRSRGPCDEAGGVGGAALSRPSPRRTRRSPMRPLRGARTVTRRAGEALHPAREPLVALERVKRALGSYNFAGQYQQRPTPLEGGLVKRAWFRHYRAGGGARAVRAHRAELGHGQQGERACRLQRLHHLGRARERLLSAPCAASEAELSRAEARCRSAAAGVRARRSC